MWRILGLLSFLFLGCFKHEKIAESVRVDVNAIAKELQIPRALMAEVEAEMAKESKNFSPVFIFIPLQVQFDELSKSVLKTPSLRYSFPKGGGSIDYKDLVLGYGSFFMSFPNGQFEKLPELVHLYFVSGSPVKKIDGESFGMGCGKWIDMKGSFTKLQTSDFLKLNTTDLRYLYVSSGHYIFVFRQGAQVYLSQLTLFDSRGGALSGAPPSRPGRVHT